MALISNVFEENPRTFRFLPLIIKLASFEILVLFLESISASDIFISDRANSVIINVLDDNDLIKLIPNSRFDNVK